MEIDKRNASQIYGTPGVIWKVNGVRYNVNWEEMEFVSHGEVEGDADIYKVKEQPVKAPPVVEPPVVEKQDTFNWNMRKDEVIKALRELNVNFSPISTRNQLINLLKRTYDAGDEQV